MSDSISRKAVLNTLDTMDKALDENRTVEAYKELLKECYKELPPVTLAPIECDDAVSREAVMKLKSHKPEYGDMIYAFDVELLPPVTPKQRWIPVSERLPEESGSYLTTTRNNAVRVNHFYAGHGRQVFGYRNNVIAWMPLPEPYKEGESE